MLGFEAGVGFFIALVLCGLAVAYIREIGMLVLAVAGGVVAWLLISMQPAHHAPVPGADADAGGWIVALVVFGYFALALIPWGLNAAKVPNFAGRALRRLLKGPRHIPEQQRS